MRKIFVLVVLSFAFLVSCTEEAGFGEDSYAVKPEVKKRPDIELEKMQNQNVSKRVVKQLQSHPNGGFKKDTILSEVMELLPSGQIKQVRKDSTKFGFKNTWNYTYNDSGKVKYLENFRGEIPVFRRTYYYGSNGKEIMREENKIDRNNSYEYYMYEYNSDSLLESRSLLLSKEKNFYGKEIFKYGKYGLTVLTGENSEGEITVESQFKYDDEGKRISRQTVSNSTIVDDESYKYDDEDRLIEIAASISKIQYIYNDNGNIEKEILLNEKGGTQYTLEMTYYDNDLLKSLAYIGGDGTIAFINLYYYEYH